MDINSIENGTKAKNYFFIYFGKIGKYVYFHIPIVFFSKM